MGTSRQMTRQVVSGLFLHYLGDTHGRRRPFSRQLFSMAVAGDRFVDYVFCRRPISSLFVSACFAGRLSTFSATQWSCLGGDVSLRTPRALADHPLASRGDGRKGAALRRSTIRPP